MGDLKNLPKASRAPDPPPPTSSRPKSAGANMFSARRGIPVTAPPPPDGGVGDPNNGGKRGKDPALDTARVPLMEEQEQILEPVHNPAFHGLSHAEVAKLSPGKKRQEYKEYWRRKARVPSQKQFPYQYNVGWSAYKPRQRPQFVYNPLTHTTDAFVTNKRSGSISQHRTQYKEQRLPPSVENNSNFNRLKGVAEYTDLTRPTHPRWSTAYHNDYNHNNKLFYPLSGPVTSFVDTMLQQGIKP